MNVMLIETSARGQWYSFLMGVNFKLLGRKWKTLDCSCRLDDGSIR